MRYFNITKRLKVSLAGKDPFKGIKEYLHSQEIKRKEKEEWERGVQEGHIVIKTRPSKKSGIKTKHILH